MAIYRRSLTAKQVLHHSQTWLNGKPPSFLGGDNQSIISYFPFNERTGTRIQDQINRHDLFMLPTFKVPQKVILVPPWKDFRLNLSYFSDITINLLGFVPLGVFTFALIRKSITSARQSFIIVTLFGLFLSLIIELIQVYLPNRSSQLMDVITNTTGTALGIVLCHFSQSLTKRKPSQG